MDDEKLFYDLDGTVGDLDLEPKDIENVTFGLYRGELSAMRAAVAKVEEDWVQYFNEDGLFFCGSLNGELASFCIIDADGDTGDIGCVGTLPEFRRRGIGLEMVKRAAIFLRERGCGRFTVRTTRLTEWYGKLGFGVYRSFTL